MWQIKEKKKLRNAFQSRCPLLIYLCNVTLLTETTCIGFNQQYLHLLSRSTYNATCYMLIAPCFHFPLPFFESSACEKLHSPWSLRSLLASMFLACVASVSARVRREKLGREQKKRNDGGGGGGRKKRLPANP